MEVVPPGFPLLGTKLHIPAWRPGSVSRPRLVAAMERGAGRRLTLISAGAGFGKTTLLAEWLSIASTGPRRVAWVSLDEGDNDPSLFWTYVVTALHAARPDAIENALSLLRSPHPSPIDSVLTVLINSLSGLDEELVLILDDLHLIEERSIHEALAFFLDRMPSTMRLVVTTRADPPLPVARLRARGQLIELRAGDLRFTPEEAASFFNEMMQLPLSASDIAALDERTEGWIAGLQLAALSMQGQRDVAGFIKSFTGDHRYIVDYLLEEVLLHQPEAVREFLLQTAILERLTGPLCDAVTGRTGGAQQLEALDRGNFFLVPLDDTRGWYRYHHLFGDVLRAHLLADRPEQVPQLHRRASAWFEAHGATSDAIRHAVAAGDGDHAADLVERAAPSTRPLRQEATLLGWLHQLPDAPIRRRPVLCNVYAGTLLSAGRIDGVEERLRDAERWLETPESMSTELGEPVIVDADAYRSLPGWVAIHRAGQALLSGDLSQTLAHARRALDLLEVDDRLGRGAAAAILGLAAWASGDLETAYRSYSEGMANLGAEGNVPDTIAGAVTLGDLRITQGRLRDARRIYERGLQLATEEGEHVLRGAADMHVGLSALLRERNELDLAADHLETSRELGEHLGFPQNPYRWRVAMARLCEIQGDVEGALGWLAEAERRYAGDFSPNVRPIPAMRARVWLAHGMLDEAREWARERGLSAGGELSYMREFEHVILARLLIAGYRRERDERVIRDVCDLLSRLLTEAENGGRTGVVIEILTLQALARDAMGDASRGIESLARALELAEPEGYVRLFVDEGAPLAGLLTRVRAQGIAPEYAGKLLHAFEPAPTPEKPSPSLSIGTSSQPLLELLTDREIDVLRLIGAGLSNREISERLFVALDTVKGHNRRIFAKLGVERRTEAMVRARELGLL